MKEFKKPSPPSFDSDEEYFIKYGKVKTEEIKNQEKYLLKIYQEKLKIYENSISKENLKIKEQPKEILESNLIYILDQVIQKQYKIKDYEDQKDLLLNYFKELPIFIKEKNRKRKGSVYNQKISDIINEISSFYLKIINKLPEEMKNQHKDVSIKTMLKDIYQNIEFKNIDKFIVVIDFIKITIMNYLFIFEKYHKDKIDEIKTDIQEFLKNVEKFDFKSLYIYDEYVSSLIQSKNQIENLIKMEKEKIQKRKEFLKTENNSSLDFIKREKKLLNSSKEVVKDLEKELKNIKMNLNDVKK